MAKAFRRRNVYVAVGRATRTVEAVIGSHRDRVLAADSEHWRLATFADVRAHAQRQADLARRALADAESGGGGEG